MSAQPYTVDLDVLYPRDDEERYRLYARTDAGLQILATAASIEAIGTAIGTMHADAKTVGGRLADYGQIGILDAVAHDWIVLPYNRKERA